MVIDGEADTEDYAYSDLRKRARGAFAFTTPNGYDSYNTDLMGGALRALCKTYEAAVARDDAGHHVNLPFSGDCPALSIDSRLPEEGRVELGIREDGRGGDGIEALLPLRLRVSA